MKKPRPHTKIPNSSQTALKSQPRANTLIKHVDQAKDKLDPRITSPIKPNKITKSNKVKMDRSNRSVSDEGLDSTNSSNSRSLTSARNKTRSKRPQKVVNDSNSSDKDVCAHASSIMNKNERKETIMAETDTVKKSSYTVDERIAALKSLLSSGIFSIKQYIQKVNELYKAKLIDDDKRRELIYEYLTWPVAKVAMQDIITQEWADPLHDKMAVKPMGLRESVSFYGDTKQYEKECDQYIQATKEYLTKADSNDKVRGFKNHSSSPKHEWDNTISNLQAGDTLDGKTLTFKDIYSIQKEWYLRKADHKDEIGPIVFNSTKGQKEGQITLSRGQKLTTFNVNETGPIIKAPTNVILNRGPRWGQKPFSSFDSRETHVYTDVYMVILAGLISFVIGFMWGFYASR